MRKENEPITAIHLFLNGGARIGKTLIAKSIYHGLVFFYNKELQNKGHNSFFHWKSCTHCKWHNCKFNFSLYFGSFKHASIKLWDVRSNE